MKTSLEIGNDIKDLTKEMGCPFIIRTSKHKNGKHYIRFVCPFHRAENPCTSFFILKGNNEAIKYHDGFWDHNHIIDQSVYGSLRLLTNKERNEIKELRSIGLTSGMTRRRMSLTINSSQMYNISRNILKLEREKISLDDTLKKLSKKWIIHTHYREENLIAVVLIARWLIGSSMSKDIWITDDTSCTNYQNMFIVPVLVIDEFGSGLMLGYSCIVDRSDECFKIIYGDILKYTKNVRVGVMDRHKGQSKAFRETTGSRIIYCRRHIRENIEKNSRWLLPMFNDFVNSKISELQYINFINARLAKDSNNQHLENLIYDLDGYSPERLENLQLLGIRYTNHIEGTFGNVKCLMDHKILELPQVLESFNIWADMLKERHYDNVRKNQGIIIKGCDSNSLGTIAKRKIEEVLNQYRDICVLLQTKNVEKALEIIGKCDHNNFKEYGIPCLCKVFKTNQNNQDGILIHVRDIPNRLLLYNPISEFHNDDCTPITKHYEPKIKLNNRSFTSTMSLFEPIATRIVRNEKKIVDLTEHFLDAVRNVQEPGGAKVTAPARKVKSSYWKQKTCSFCGQKGHNQRGCPKRIKQISIFSTPEEKFPSLIKEIMYFIYDEPGCLEITIDELFRELELTCTMNEKDWFEMWFRILPSNVIDSKDKKEIFVLYAYIKWIVETTNPSKRMGFIFEEFISKSDLEWTKIMVPNSIIGIATLTMLFDNGYCITKFIEKFSVVGKARNIKVSLLQYIYRKRAFLPLDLNEPNDRDLKQLILSFPNSIINMDIKKEAEGVLLKAIHNIFINSIALGLKDLLINDLIEALEELKKKLNNHMNSMILNHEVNEFLIDLNLMKHHMTISFDSFIEIIDYQILYEMNHSFKNSLMNLRLMKCSKIPRFIFFKVNGIEELDLRSTELIECGPEINIKSLRKIYFPKTLANVRDGSLKDCHRLELVYFMSNPIIEITIPLNVKIIYLNK